MPRFVGFPRSFIVSPLCQPSAEGVDRSRASHALAAVASPSGDEIFFTGSDGSTVSPKSRV